MIKNKLNDKIYIGQTTRTLSSRLKDHINEKRNRHISLALNKYGLENFELHELCSCFSLQNLNDMEVYFVNKFNSLHPYGYNHRAGGDQNGICSEELKRKISLSKINKPNLKRRGEIRSLEQRKKISRSLNGKPIIAVNLKDGKIKEYITAHDTKKDGHNPSNVINICKKHNRRFQSKGWTFYYKDDFYANQSGSLELKNFKHAQRLESEPANAEYNLSTSHRRL